MIQNEKTGTKSVTLIFENQELVPSNPNVIAVAEKLHWRPITTVRRIQKALPAVFEQQLYLVLGASFGILPETMAKLLRIFLESRSMVRSDMNYKVVGKNLVSKEKGYQLNSGMSQSLNLKYNTPSLLVQSARLD